MGLAYQKYKDGVLALGLGLGLGLGGYVILNSYPQPRDRKNVVVRKTLGVVVDSSLPMEEVKRLKSILYDVIETYNERFKINYDVKFKFTTFRRNPTKSEILKLKLPVTHTMFLVADNVQDQTNWLGYTSYKTNSIIINHVRSQCTDQLFTVMAHELGHINGYYSHTKDSICIMSEKTGCERKHFCPGTIETILSKK